MFDHTMRELGPPDIYDNTMLSQWNCPRKFYWFQRGLTYRGIAPYFTFGKAFGAGLNVFHKTQDKMELRNRIALALETIDTEWAKDMPIENNYDTLENCKTTFLLYVDNYGESEPWSMPYGEGELGFVLPIPGTTFSYGGAIDSPIEWNPHGILIREDKTTGGYITDSYNNQWEHATQIIGYFWATEMTIGKVPFGVYMNIISKKPRKDNALRFNRILIKKDPEDVRIWLNGVIRTVDDIRREWDRWEWPKYGARDPINCAGGMGRSACPYRRFCLMEAEPWDLEENYNYGEEFIWREKWEPWKREGENE